MGVRISTTFSVLRPLYFDLLSNLDFLLVEKHRSKYRFGRSKVFVEVKFGQKSRSKVGGPNFGKGRRSTEKVEVMRTRSVVVIRTNKK